MPRANRAQRFLVNPHAWMDDPAVQAMTLEARGAYAVLWLAGWDQKEPGVYLADDRVLAQLARCTPEEWERVRDMVRQAFVTERDRWVLPRFSVTLASQNAKRDRDRKRQQRKRMRERNVPRDSKGESLDGSGSGSGSGSGALEPTSMSPSGDGFVLVAPEAKTRTRRLVASPEDTDWREAFDRYFWPDYLSLGRKAPKAEALKAWLSIPHRTPQEAFDKLDAAFQSAKKTWQDEQRPVRAIPHAATWLRQYRDDSALEGQ